MYKVTKAFIYRAKLYPVGRELTEREYERMMRDRVAAKRGVPDMVAPHGPKKPDPPVILLETQEQPVQAPARKPGRPKKVVDTATEAEQPVNKVQKSAKPQEPAVEAKPPTRKPKKTAKPVEG